MPSRDNHCPNPASRLTAGAAGFFELQPIWTTPRSVTRSQPLRHEPLQPYLARMLASGCSMCSFRRTPAGSCAGCSPRSSCAPRSARAAGPSRFSSNRRNACGSFRRCRRNWKVARPRSPTHYLAIDQTQPHLEVVHGLRHQRIALRPVVAPAGDQPDAYRIAPGQQPETVVLDLVNPVGAGRGLAGWVSGASAYAYARSTYR